MTRVMLAPLTKTSPGTNGRKYITIHETANRTKGANASLNRIIEQVDESIAAALAEGAEFDVNVTVTPKEDESQ